MVYVFREPETPTPSPRTPSLRPKSVWPLSVGPIFGPSRPIGWLSWVVLRSRSAKYGWPESVWPDPVAAFPWSAQHFVFYFPLPPQIVFFFVSSEVSSSGMTLTCEGHGPPNLLAQVVLFYRILSRSLPTLCGGTTGKVHMAGWAL